MNIFNLPLTVARVLVVGRTIGGGRAYANGCFTAGAIAING